MMTKMIAKTAATALVAALTFGAGMAATTTAAQASEHCKRVHISVSNPTGAPVKVIDIDYYDFGKRGWRKEGVKNRVLRRGQVWTWKKRLEKVGAERTAVRIKYRTYIGKTFNKWSKVQTVTSRTRVCHHNSTWKFRI